MSASAIVEDLYREFAAGTKKFSPEVLISENCSPGDDGGPGSTSSRSKSKSKAKKSRKEKDEDNRDKAEKASSKKKKKKPIKEDRSRSRSPKKKRSRESTVDKDYSRDRSRRERAKRERKSSCSDEEWVERSVSENDIPQKKSRHDSRKRNKKDKKEKSRSDSKEKRGRELQQMPTVSSIGSVSKNGSSFTEGGWTENKASGSGVVEEIKAVKLSEYLKVKGHEIPPELEKIEAEAETTRFSRSSPEPPAKEKSASPSLPPKTDTPEPPLKAEKSKKEEFFPLAKPVQPKKDKIFETDKKPVDFVPRNLKVKPVTKDGNIDVSKAAADAKTIANNLNEEKEKSRSPRPPPKRALGKFQPVSEDEEEFPLLRKRTGAKAKEDGKGNKKIVFGALKSVKRIEEHPLRASHYRGRNPGEEGEIPSSDAGESSGDSLDLNNDTDGELKEESDREEGKKSAKKKQRKKRTPTPTASDSSDSDSERERERSRDKRKKKRKSRHRHSSHEDDGRRHRKDRHRHSSSHADRGEREHRDRYPPMEYYRADFRGHTYHPRGFHPYAPFPPFRGRGEHFFRRGGPMMRGRWNWARGGYGARRPRSPYSSTRVRRRSGSYSRSRSGSRSGVSEDEETKEKGIDKKRLLEIAKRNASAMLQVGTMQQLKNMSAEEIATLKSGGKSVAELVEHCKKLQKRRRRDGSDVSSSSSNEEERPRRKSDEETDFINHPFALSNSKNIVMNIPNAVPLPVMTPAQRAHTEVALRQSFPVSSGQQHRKKEAEPTNTPYIPLPPTVPKAITEKGEPDEDSMVPLELLPLPPPPPLIPPPPVPPTMPLPPLAIEAPLPPPPPPAMPSHQQTIAPIAAPTPIFDEPPPPPPQDIGSIVGQRLHAIKKLQGNPNDTEALKLMHCAEQQMKQWAESKNLPGAFTGTTGVQILTPQELAPPDKRFQAWAKKDQLHTATKVQSHVGEHLLRKMGWKPGERLGKHQTGCLEPLSLDIKSDRKGLVALEEMPASKSRPHVPLTRDLQGKHPVSALMEVCSKRRWPPPSFSCVESGSAHNRRFLWKCVVNGVEYQSATPSQNKKSGKGISAQVVLQSLGLVPRESSLPIVIG